MPETINLGNVLAFPNQYADVVVGTEGEYALVVKVPDGDFVVRVCCRQPKPGCRFDHPNLLARKNSYIATRAYWPSGRKKWFETVGVEFYLGFRREQIELICKPGYSWVDCTIGGIKQCFNVSGGTGDGKIRWADWLRPVVNISLVENLRGLHKLADIAMTPDEAVQRGVQFTLDRSYDDAIENLKWKLAEFKLKVGDGLYLQGEDQVYTVRNLQRRKIIAGDSMVNYRIKHTQVDWKRTALLNNYDLGLVQDFVANEQLLKKAEAA